MGLPRRLRAEIGGKACSRPQPLLAVVVCAAGPEQSPLLEGEEQKKASENFPPFSTPSSKSRRTTETQSKQLKTVRFHFLDNARSHVFHVLKIIVQQPTRNVATLPRQYMYVKLAVNDHTPSNRLNFFNRVLFIT